MKKLLVISMLAGLCMEFYGWVKLMKLQFITLEKFLSLSINLSVIMNNKRYLLVVILGMILAVGSYRVLISNNAN